MAQLRLYLELTINFLFILNLLMPAVFFLYLVGWNVWYGQKIKTISKYFFKLLYSSSLKLFLHSDCTGKAFFAHIKVPWNFILLKVTYTLNRAYEDLKNIKTIWARNVCASCVAAAQKQLTWFFVTRAENKKCQQ